MKPERVRRCQKWNMIVQSGEVDEVSVYLVCPYRSRLPVTALLFKNCVSPAAYGLIGHVITQGNVLVFNCLACIYSSNGGFSEEHAVGSGGVREEKRNRKYNCGSSVEHRLVGLCVGECMPSFPGMRIVEPSPCSRDSAAPSSIAKNAFHNNHLLRSHPASFSPSDRSWVYSPVFKNLPVLCLTGIQHQQKRPLQPGSM
ncbi:hypothetical protein AOQ84DRAFT_106677 [Glonium stellatum]|uniref:Uncharacterized protein n=1 Tax=Glonium stellatum TaxID=574774 RepID=A0A8E2EUI8_9PEZI|nr:hypothetical protein AOQ84DRAFT_106677 [Glonium stellatum]